MIDRGRRIADAGEEAVRAANDLNPFVDRGIQITDDHIPVHWQADAVHLEALHGHASSKIISAVCFDTLDADTRGDIQHIVHGV